MTAETTSATRKSSSVLPGDWARNRLAILLKNSLCPKLRGQGPEAGYATVLRWDPPTAAAVPAHVPAPQDGPSREELAEEVRGLRSHIADISPPSYTGHDHE
jgi:hypothetical protein